MSSKNIFIGSGLIFPITLNSEGRPDIKSDIELIRSSILNIIYWPKGRRFFNQKYGCDIERCLEEPDDSVSKALIKHYVVEAIELWEKKVETIPSLIKVLDSKPTIVNIQITYIIKNTKETDTFVFPFYKNITF